MLFTLLIEGCTYGASLPFVQNFYKHVAPTEHIPVYRKYSEMEKYRMNVPDAGLVLGF
jgi:hypothetical protein